MDGSSSTGYDDRMRLDPTALPAERIPEVALWCSLQAVTELHKDSPDEARRRRLMKEANSLLASAKYPVTVGFDEAYPTGGAGRVP
jgi:hypothetical protein